MLEYDPYLDPNLIPKIPKEWDDAEYLKAHSEIAEQAAAKKKEADTTLTRLREDKEANLIFARQDYQLRDGIVLGLDREKTYLYLNATEEFVAGADAKLKKMLPTIQRAEPETEKKIIDTIDEERQKSDQGLGFVFS